MWFSFRFRNIRVLNAEPLSHSGALMLVIRRPASLLDVLILAASLDGQVHCLVERDLLRGFIRRCLAWGLGMIAEEREADGLRSSLEQGREVLIQGGTLAVFAVEERPGREGESQPTARLCTLLGPESGSAASPRVTVVSVYLLLPVARPGAEEALIYLGEPIRPERLSPSEDGASLDTARGLRDVLCRSDEHNPFALRSESTEQFLADLYELFRGDLEEEWALRKETRQHLEGFTLSRFVAAWVDYLNRTDPGRLVAYREWLYAYREEQRVWSLRRLQVETAGDWIRSWRRLTAGAEGVAGFPLALYGTINHLVVGLVLLLLGSFNKTRLHGGAARWISRGLVVLGCYAAEIDLIAHWLGRSAAGYFALTLPVSGAYLWRYIWLLRNRIKVLIAASSGSGAEARLRRVRKEFIREFNAARDLYAETLGLAR